MKKILVASLVPVLIAIVLAIGAFSMASGPAAPSSPTVYIGGTGSQGVVVNVVNTGQNPALYQSVLTGPSGGFGSMIINQSHTRVYLLDGSSIVTINTADNTIVTLPTPVQNAWGLATDPAETYFYVGASPNGSEVLKIDRASGNIVATIPMSQGFSYVSLAMNPNGSLLYATLDNPGAIDIISTATNQVVATVSVTGSPRRVTMNHSGSRLYVATHDNDDSIAVIDTSDPDPTHSTVIANVTGGGTANNIMVSPDDSRAYVTNSNGNSVSVIDTAINRVIDTIPVGSDPEDVATDSSGSTLYVVCDNANTMWIVDPQHRKPPAIVAVGPNPQAVVVKP